MTDLTLSASSVEAYKSCPQRWYLQYIERHEGDQSVERITGLAVHAGVENYFKARLAGLQFAAGYPDEVDVHDLTFLMESSALADPDEDLTKAMVIGRRVLLAFIEDIAQDMDPQHVELPGTITVNGIRYSYHIDWTTTTDEVHDLKVKGSPPRYPGDWAFAATGYALGFRAETGRIENDIVYDVMIRLKRDRPRHIPYRNGGPATRTAVGLFASQLERVAEGIAKGSFPPLGLERGICKWCPVKDVCDYYQATLDVGPDNTAAGHEHWGDS